MNIFQLFPFYFCGWYEFYSRFGSSQTSRTILLAHVRGTCRLDFFHVAVTCATTKRPETRLHVQPIRDTHLKGLAWILLDHFQCYKGTISNIRILANYFCKCCEAYPVANTDAPEMVKVFTENWISYDSVSLELHIDQTTEGTSNQFCSQRFENC